VIVLWIAIGLAAVLFGLPVLLGGPPYVPTLTRSMETALDMLDLEAGQTLLDIGSGDGRVLAAAARRGWRAVGIEISPFLVVVARVRCWRYRKQVRVLWGNYFTTKWPPADAVFGFNLQRQMGRLDQLITQWHTKPVRLASFAFTIPGRKPVGERDGVRIYEYK
jgi:SAM-dependent methyltransferase